MRTDRDRVSRINWVLYCEQSALHVLYVNHQWITRNWTFLVMDSVIIVTASSCIDALSNSSIQCATRFRLRDDVICLTATGLHLLDFDRTKTVCDHHAISEYNRLCSLYTTHLGQLVRMLVWMGTASLKNPSSVSSVRWKYVQSVHFNSALSTLMKTRLHLHLTTWILHNWVPLWWKIFRHCIVLELCVSKNATTSTKQSHLHVTKLQCWGKFSKSVCWISRWSTICVCT